MAEFLLFLLLVINLSLILSQSRVLLVYVIAWGRGQLRIDFTSIFKVFKKLPELQSKAKQSNIAITCLSHKVQHFVQRTTFKVLPSRKQVCGLSLFNRLAVARRKPTIIVSKTQQVQFTQQFLYKQNYKQANFIHLFCEACNG